MWEQVLAQMGRTGIRRYSLPLLVLEGPTVGVAL